jgi:hypothetical protein
MGKVQFPACYAGRQLPDGRWEVIAADADRDQHRRRLLGRLDDRTLLRQLPRLNHPPILLGRFDRNQCAFIRKRILGLC